MTKKGKFAALIVAMAAPFLIYWLGGGNFERGTTLGLTAYASFGIAVLGFIAMVMP